ncbi:Membrane protein involved in the export of O-antigen and teichoic acid [Lachnospiraceae bacterium RM5]|nr:Membrane protein involved in the export of O-antigen and teichoic acid [Lachnospiraceae bacterium RM5]
MQKLKETVSSLLLIDKNKKRATFFWNAFGAVMNSFQTMLLLLIITRFGNDTDSGIFVMAYAVGNLMLNIGKYGVRHYQVTDISEKQGLKDYVKARYASMTFMMIAIGAYLLVKIFFYDYSVKKTVVILMICLVKAIEAFEDVFHGRMQQKGRLDVAGRILGIRLMLFIVGYAAFYIVTGNLILTTFINLVLTLVIAIIMNGSVMHEFRDDNREDTKENVGRILIECLPLCACMCLNMYIANAPKYAIDTVVSDEVQTKFNIIFMPVFIIALLTNFIFQPFLKGVGEMWAEERVMDLAKSTVKFTVLIVIMDLIITFVGSYIGNPVLGMVYGVDLSDYNKELVIFMLAGGLIALQNLFIMIITAVRYQKFMIYGYIVIAGIMVYFGRIVLGNGSGNKLTNLCYFFLGVMSMLTMYCIALIAIAIIKKKGEMNEVLQG